MREREREAQHAAQELVWDAWECRYKRDRVRLAREALALWPNCADAYVVLAEDSARTLARKADLYRRGVAAGERAIGDRPFRAADGLFWGVLERRPYMRARGGLAMALWDIGEWDEALEHMRALLRLNPNDNQGIRHVLAACLLDRGEHEELTRLLHVYEDDTDCTWGYTAAILAFRLNGDTPTSRQLLSSALAANPFVGPFLLGRAEIPRTLPDSAPVGSEVEAAYYARRSVAAWQATPGALEWLAALRLDEG